jgi:hypothetical protein
MDVAVRRILEVQARCSHAARHVATGTPKTVLPSKKSHVT